MFRMSGPRLRRVVVWLLLTIGWVVVASLAGWWARSQDIGWALDEGPRGPSYLLVSSLAYWGVVFCVALVRAARES